MRMTAAQAMAECLQREAVPVVFGLPGAAICPFYDALSQTEIRHILVRQEQNAAHAASGYARISGRPGVCIATSGPGALNLITGIATAYMDSIPLVVITGQVVSDLLGRDVFQEADITGSCEPFVKHSYLVKRAEDIPRIFKEAFHIASTGRNGPVLIDVPMDVQKAELDFAYPEKAEIRSYKPSSQGHPGQIKRVLAALKEAERPLICAGGGVFSAKAEEELRSFSERSGIPVVTTMMGISSIPPQYPRNLGMIGMHGAPSANRAMNAADLLLLIGARVGDRAIMSPMGLSQSATIIHIDIDPAEIGKNMGTDIPLVGDARQILLQLLEKLDSPPVPDWTAEYRPASPVQPVPVKEGCVCAKAVMASLFRQAEEDAVLAADVGQNQIWSARGYRLARGRFLTSGGMGTMGYALPAAVGAKLAAPNRQVVAVCGDGSFQMSMMELGTAVQHGVDVKLVVVRNNRLGLVREIQQNRYGGREIAVDLSGSPSACGIAAAYGIPAWQVSDNGSLGQAVERLLRTDGPALIECLVDPKEATE